MQVFISCPSRSFDLGGSVAQRLTRAGFNVWFFDAETTGSQPSEISNFRVNGIGKADVFIVIVTQHTVASIGVAREVSLAKRYNVPILPVLLEDDAQLPDYLPSEQVVRIETISDDNIQKLVMAIRAIGEQGKRDQSPVKRRRDSVSKGEEDGFVPRVFIAYSHKQRSIAKTLSDLLLKNAKPHFWDAKIKAGATWRQTIQRALDDATHLVVIWTPDAAESDEVEREVSYALAQRKVIVPILSKEIPKLPYHLHGLHYIVLEEDVATIEAELLKAIAQFFEDEDIWQ